DTMARKKKTVNLADLRLMGHQMDPSFSGGRYIRMSAGEISRTPPGEAKSSHHEATYFDEFWMEETEDVGPSNHLVDSLEESEQDESDGGVEEEAAERPRVAAVVRGENDQEMELKCSRWQLEPHFAGGSDELPALTKQEWDQIVVHFQVESLAVQGKNLNIPKSWLPSCSQFKDHVFLASAGLDHGLDQAFAMSKFPPVEKGQINTKEWLTQMVEQKLKGIVGGPPAKFEFRCGCISISPRRICKQLSGGIFPLVQVDSDGFIDLSSLLKVTEGYGKPVSLSVKYNKTVIANKKFLVDKRELRMVTEVQS
ncbi:hypothetical protein SOVF_021210, partial [Spinacia oleracea]